MDVAYRTLAPSAHLHHQHIAHLIVLSIPTQYGTTLATIRNDSDARQLMEMVLAANCGTGDAGTRNTWIGLNDQSVHDSWEWVSGEEWYVHFPVHMTVSLEKYLDFLHM